MKKITTLALFAALVGSSMAQIAGTWTLSPVETSLAVGPAKGDFAWWKVPAAEITGVRACQFDDEVVFNVFFIGKVEYLDVSLDFVVARNIDEVLDGAPFRGFVAFRNFVDTHPETTSLFCKDQQVVMICSYKKMFQEIFISCSRTFRSYSSPVLNFIFI